MGKRSAFSLFFFHFQQKKKQIEKKTIICVIWLCCDRYGQLENSAFNQRTGDCYMEIGLQLAMPSLK